MGPSGREGTLYHVRPGEICVLAASCLLHDRPYPAEAEVEEEVEGWFVAAPDFRRAFASEVVVREAVLAALAHGFFSLVDLLEDAVFGTVDARLARHLLDRTGAGTPGEEAGRLETTHERLAADLWTSREVVSRLLKQFEHEGLVRIERGRIVLRDAAALGRRAVHSG